LPRYFFDVHDDVDIVDDMGQELPDLRAARDEAARALSEAAKDMLISDGPRKELQIVVRDSSSVVLKAKLAFTTEPEF
jgi:hypothetical protein